MTSALVLGPKNPTAGVMPLAFWNLASAARVSGPNLVTSLPGEPGPLLAIGNPTEFKKTCNVLASPEITVALLKLRLNENGVPFLLVNICLGRVVVGMPGVVFTGVIGFCVAGVTKNATAPPPPPVGPPPDDPPPLLGGVGVLGHALVVNVAFEDVPVPALLVAYAR